MDASSGIDMTFGMVLIGLTVTASLFGVTSSQALWYYRHYPHDRQFLRALVFTVWFLDAASLLLYSAATWDYLVNKTLLLLGELKLPWTSNAQIVVNAIAIGIIQSFYTYRIWTLTKYKALTIIVVIFILADLALGFVVFVKSFTTQALEDFVRLISFDVALSIVTAATDILLCGMLVALLASSRTGTAGSKRLINRLLFYTINTGLITSICSVASLISVIILPAASVYVMCYYIGSRMYTVSLFATLNAREGLRLQTEEYAHASLPPSTSTRARSSSSSKSVVHRRSVRAVVDAMAPSKQIVVAIQRDTTITFDEDEERSRHSSQSQSRSQSQSVSQSQSQSLSLDPIDASWTPVADRLCKPGRSSESSSIPWSDETGAQSSSARSSGPGQSAFRVE